MEIKSRIETERFYLRPLNKLGDDLSTYLTWMQDVNSNPHIEGVDAQHTEESLRAYIEEKSESNEALLLGIFTRSDSKHIGNIKYEPINVQKGEAWLGILIGDPEWRNVQAGREVISETISWMNRNMCISVFFLGVSRVNIAAVKSYKAAGFIEIGSEVGKDNQDVAIMKRDLTET